MLNRRSNFYVSLPDTVKGKEAKMNVSIGLVVPKELEGKTAAEDFIDEQMEDLNKAFKKFVKKRIEKVEKGK